MGPIRMARAQYRTPSLKEHADNPLISALPQLLPPKRAYEVMQDQP